MVSFGASFERPSYPEVTPGKRIIRDHFNEHSVSLYSTVYLAAPQISSNVTTGSSVLADYHHTAALLQSTGGDFDHFKLKYSIFEFREHSAAAPRLL